MRCQVGRNDYARLSTVTILVWLRNSARPRNPPSVFNSSEFEERRRTFWVLYILNLFEIIPTKSGVAFDHNIFQARMVPLYVLNLTEYTDTCHPI